MFHLTFSEFSFGCAHAKERRTVHASGKFEIAGLSTAHAANATWMHLATKPASKSLAVNEMEHNLARCVQLMAYPLALSSSVRLKRLKRQIASFSKIDNASAVFIALNSPKRPQLYRAKMP